MGWAGDLRRELSARNQQIATTNGSLHEMTASETRPASSEETHSCRRSSAGGRKVSGEGAPREVPSFLYRISLSSL
jgi:hypothetical protein